MPFSTDPYASAPLATGAAARAATDEALQQTTQQALDLTADSLNSLRKQAWKLWDDVRPHVDKAVSHAKEEPTKSMLMVVVAGALIVTLVMASRRATPADVAASKKWLRALAADATERARDNAEEASAMKDSAVTSAERTTSQAHAGVSDRLQNLRDKTGPLLEQIRPQLDNVAGHAKKNPLASLIAATAASALLSRLTK